MESLALIGLLIVAGVLAAPIVAIVAFNRTSKLQQEIGKLREDVARLREQVVALKRGRSAPVAEEVEPPTEPTRDEGDLSKWAPPVRSARDPEPAPVASKVAEPPAPDAPPTEVDVEGTAPDAAESDSPSPPGADDIRAPAGDGATAAVASEPPADPTAPPPDPDRDPDPTRDGVAETPEPEGEPEPSFAGAGSDSGAWRAEAGAAGAGAGGATSSPADSAIDFETKIGTTWLLRIGLGVLAIALALFARSIVPQMSAPAKVALAYAGAIALFAFGKRFETRLDRWARPVMAAGLTFGFFVAFASHFVPAMRAVPLGASLIWMVVSMATVLIAAERWHSQMTAVLAVGLGHVSAFVAAGAADMYTLVMITFLAATAAALTLRHAWVGLGLFAVAASYGSHLLWLAGDRSPIAGDTGFWLNLVFLTAYYVIFLTGDVLWWRRDEDRDPDELTDAQARVARQIGPANLVLYASLASFAYIATGAGLDTIEWYYLTLGTVQGVLAAFYFSVHHRDYVFYPAFGTVLWTLGWFAALDALALNLVLAAQALLLLIAAHHTRLLIFHALAQAALFVALVHYLVYPQPTNPGVGLLIGGLGIAGVYLLKASLEEVWYGDDQETPWLGSDEEGGPLDQLIDQVLRPVAPYLASVHAAVGGLVIVRELVAYYDPFSTGATEGLPRLAIGLLLAHVLLAALSYVRRGGALLFALTSLTLSMPFLAGVDGQAETALMLAAGFLLVALTLMEVTERSGRAPTMDSFMAHGLAIAVVVLLGGYVAFEADPPGADRYAAALAAPLLIWTLLERLHRRGYALPARSGEGTSSAGGVILLVMSVATAGLVFGYTLEAFGLVPSTLAWVAVVSATLAAAARFRTSEVLFLGAYALLVIGYVGLTSRGFDWPEALAILWLGVLALAVPLGLAAGMDRALGVPGDERSDRDNVAEWLTYAMYGLALVVVTAFSSAQLPEGWALAAPALLAVVMLAGGGRAGLSRSGLSAVLLVFGLHLFAITYFGGRQDASLLLVPLLGLSILTLVAERFMGEAPFEEATTVWKRLGAGLVIVAAWTAMAAIYDSVALGRTWATAGWSAVGISLMVAGFALRSAVHRRVALAVLACCLIRVFAVDTQGLSDSERTVAFLVLGLSLVGAAWLYSRYSEELKSWL